MRIALALLAALGLAGCGPLVMIPGGELSGEVRPAPADWSFSDAVDTVQLETRPSDPYSVNVWGVGLGERFYIASGGGRESRWAQYMLENGDVRLRIDGAIYELRATLTEDPGELDAFLEAAQRKYEFEPEPEQRAKAILFRLDPR
jgi:hypothetical protein